MEIKNVIICGLGALGLTYANKLKNVCNLYILANEERIEKYKKFPPTLNNRKINLNYITPNDFVEADLIIISTKSTGLNDAIKYIKNFVNKNTIIISLINGISSEEKISLTYPNTKILYSFFIGHSAMGRTINGERKFYQDGVGKIVFEPCDDLENFFKKNNIDYEISNDILYSQWVKFGVNIILNQPSALYEMTVGELRNQKEFLPLAKNLLKEVKQVAQLVGIQNLENYENDVLESTNLIADDGKTSMYQDILAKKQTEVDIFSGEIIELANKLGVQVPYNEEIYNLIKEKETIFQQSLL